MPVLSHIETIPDAVFKLLQMAKTLKSVFRHSKENTSSTRIRRNHEQRTRLGFVKD